MNDLLYHFSYALDCVEHDLVGTTTHHGQRVACMCVAMGDRLGYSKEKLLDLAGIAILHDNALTEYIQDEWRNGVDILKDSERVQLGAHCVKGERNLSLMPFQESESGSILYHHENADGTGPFHKTTDEVCMNAQLIHVADQVDALWDLSHMNREKYNSILDFMKEQENRMFSSLCVQLFHESCTYELLAAFGREKALVMLQEKLPRIERDYTDEQIKGISDVIANIVDYKSKFTRTHSIGIAQKAERMGIYYGYSPENVTKLYFAGAMHDIGKLVVDRDILEKPDKLTDHEYTHMKNHAYYTYDILRRIEGMGEVTMWASLHHEKLDGSGYPFGKKADELTEPERLMACVDIYQALTEKRPYKDGMPHEKAIAILQTMVDKGQLDGRIVDDIDKVFDQQNVKEENMDAR